MADELINRGHRLITGGTSNHLMLLDVRSAGLTGNKVQDLCDAIHITLNKNTVVGDTSAMNPGGVRIGTPAVTSRGYIEDDCREVGRFLDEATKIGLELQSRANSKKLKDFKIELEKSQEVK